MVIKILNIEISAFWYILRGDGSPSVTARSVTTLELVLDLGSGSLSIFFIVEY